MTTDLLAENLIKGLLDGVLKRKPAVDPDLIHKVNTVENFFGNHLERYKMMVKNGASRPDARKKVVDDLEATHGPAFGMEMYGRIREHEIAHERNTGERNPWTQEMLDGKHGPDLQKRAQEDIAANKRDYGPWGKRTPDKDDGRYVQVDWEE